MRSDFSLNNSLYCSEALPVGKRWMKCPHRAPFDVTVSQLNVINNGFPCPRSSMRIDLVPRERFIHSTTVCRMLTHLNLPSIHIVVGGVGVETLKLRLEHYQLLLEHNRLCMGLISQAPQR